HAREPVVGIAAHAREDLLVADLRALFLVRHVAVELDGDVGAVALAVAEHDDAARGMPVREPRGDRGGASRMDLTVGVHDEIEDGGTRDRATLLLRVRARRAAQARELPLE